MNDIYSVRKGSNDILMKFVEPLRKVNPDVLTAFSFFVAIACGILFYLGESWYFLLAALIALVLSSVLDALDGPLARLTNKASKKGDFLDHTLDRFADVFIFGGVVLGGHIELLWGMIAIIVILLVSYLGVQAQALGVHREYRGLIGRAYRLFFLMIATLLTVFYSGKIEFNSVRFDFLGWTMVFFLIAGIITVCQRWLYTWRALKGLEKDEG